MSRIAREFTSCATKCNSFCQANTRCRLKPAYSTPVFRTLAAALSSDVRSPSYLLSSPIFRSKPDTLRHGVEFTSVRFAGHSHWHNIRHIKESKDALKQKASLDVVRRIKLAVQEGGGANPKLNFRLARVLEDGKAKDVSSVTMLDVLKRMEKGRDMKGASIYVEAMGIGNCMVIVEAFTDRPKWLRQEIQHVMKKFGGRIGEAGSSAHSFNFKGIVYLLKNQEKPLSEDEAFEIAIEVGAEEVIQGQNEDGHDSYQLICAPKELHAVKKALEGRGFKPESARLEYIPHVFTKLNEASLEVASRMLDSLEAVEETVRVYDNIES